MIKPMVFKMIRHAAGGAACVFFAACAPTNPGPVQPIPPGPTAEEIAQYARAQNENRIGQATGDGDAVIYAAVTFQEIPREILSRQDPKLFEAQVICETYPQAAPVATGRRLGLRPTIDPQFVRPCEIVKWRYNEATIAIRSDLEARIAAADRSTIAQAEAVRQ